MSERHELFDELDAFQPAWQKVFHSLEDAVHNAADQTPYILELYLDYISEPRSVDGVPDVKKYFEECQKLDAESALPYKLDDIGFAHLSRHYDD